MSDHKKYTEMFEYLRTVPAPSERKGVLAFGRNDGLVAQKIVDLSRMRFAEFVVISGGTGKDSTGLKVPEAEFLAEKADKYAKERGIELPQVYTETHATNGGENVRNSLAIMKKELLPYRAGLTAVAHATSARRLTATLEHELVVAGEENVPVYGVPTSYTFKPENLHDQTEARAEILRLADWPERGLLQPQPDLPESLVDFARDNHK